MAYQALYRQWRPKTFSQMIGQSAVIGTLRNQVVTGRIAHAYLFCGSRGTGKTSTAKILARAINCEHPENGDPCGVCDNCLRMEREESLDVIEIDAASNNGVEEIRELRETVKYPPQYGKYKVYIIDEVHMLSTSAFNALLKTLEEPPAHIVFILATTEPQKLPETILSRCQRFDFGRLSVSDIQRRLAEAVEDSGTEATPGALMMIARAAEGGMRDAFSMLDMCLGYGRKVDENLVREILGTSDRAFLFRFADALLQEDISAAFEMIAELIQDGRDPAVFAKEMAAHFRMLLIVKTCGNEKDISFQDLTEEDYRDFARQGEGFTVTRLMKMMELFMGLETEMRYASSPRLSLENAALKCIVKMKENDPQALLDRIEELEKKMTELSSGAVRVRGGGKGKAASGKTQDDASEADGLKAPPIADPTNVHALGEGLMDQLRKRGSRLTGVLMMGNWESVRDGSLIWKPKEGPAAHVFIRTLQMPEEKRMLEEILRELTGTEMHFQIAEPGSDQGKAAAEEKSEQAHIQSLVNVFGEEPVDVVE